MPRFESVMATVGRMYFLTFDVSSWVPRLVRCHCWHGATSTASKTMQNKKVFKNNVQFGTKLPCPLNCRDVARSRTTCKVRSLDVSGVLHNMWCYLQVLKRLREPLNLRLAAIQDSQGSHEQFFFVCEGSKVRIYFSIPLVSTFPVSVSTARNFDFFLREPIHLSKMFLISVRGLWHVT